MALNPAAGTGPGGIQAKPMGQHSLEPSLAIPVPPLLDARDLRLSIVMSLKQYRQLRELSLLQGRSNEYHYSASDHRRPATSGDDQADAVAAPARQASIDREIRFGMVRSSLLIDIRDLLQKTKALQRRLLAHRWRTWLVHTALALVSHAVCVRWISYLFPPPAGSAATTSPYYDTLHGRRPDNTLRTAASLLQWAGYPVAMYSVVTFERSVSTATRLREDLETMEREVAEGAEVYGDDSLSELGSVASLA
ncbi:hypothetical protein B0T25DRAFT_632955 [Lasiosphaeria hispida]|uniref:Uncharacterized protein n=1 Tax=Lasiosphaeria hispida TaxID=260671 RepID=A0AAJ0HEW7_9PEZI|nr:hypothetical protein B0T25DRAFT_632955 [Lasiosphaeria hispida]